MGTETGISWTDHTYNPWWGCTKVSAGCDNCYADTLAGRFGFEIWGKDAERRFFGDKHWAEPIKWDRDAAKAGIRARVFCGSMCDWAEGRPDQLPARRRLFDLIERTPNLDWQLLTKRPGAILNLIPRTWIDNPLPNVWYGRSVENQEQAGRRIPQLLRVPAVVRFLSCEPLLGPVDLDQAARHFDGTRRPNWGLEIHWVIVGGESGAHHRPFDPQWARDLRDQCGAAGVAYWFKQHGGLKPTSGGDLLDGVQYHEFPQGLSHVANN